LTNVIENLNRDLENISLWLKVNKLSLNIKKTHYMLFTNKKIREQNIPLVIDNQTIEEVEKTKFLGVFIDNKLKWKHHVNSVSGKISKGMGMLIKARNYLNRDGLVTLYNAFIYPYLTYCNHVWGNTHQNHLNMLSVLQNKIVRIIAGVKPRQSCDPLYKKLGIMKLNDINTYLIAKFMHRRHIQKVPEHIFQFFSRNDEIFPYNLRTAHHLQLPKVKSELAKNSIRFRGAYIWNFILGEGLNVDVSEASFTKYIKNIFISDTVI